jgi:hypothetical protein
MLPWLPCGHVVRLMLSTTWGDVSYVGLNGIELFDASGAVIPLQPSQVTAVPASVAVLGGAMATDCRKATNLIDGVNDTWDARHMWLTPFTPFHPVSVYIVFDWPVALAAIKLWNYSRTPARGVQDMQILLDDVIVWEGVVRKAPPAPHPDKTTTTTRTAFAHTILFAADDALVARERSCVYDPGPIEQDVLFYNERRLMVQGGKPASSAPVPDYTAQRPNTSVSLARP